jgi:predicted ribosomally synthesized peptide with SipW-like signal peptide
MRTKHKFITAGVGASALALGVAITGGTSASFYDDETQQGTFQAGSVDLVTSGVIASQSVNPLGSVTYDPATKTLHASNLQPGDTFTYDVTFKNAGSLNASPYMKWTIADDSENGVIEAEDTDPTPAGELDNVMTVLYNIDAFGSSASGVPTPVNNTFNAPAHYLSFDMAPGLERHAKFTFTVPNGGQGAENQIMTDSFDLIMDFALTQVGAPVPTI